MGRAERREINEADVLAFAGVSRDKNPIHLFGEQPIAHGMLTASYFESLIERTFRHLADVSSLSLQFETPVKMGADLTTQVRVSENPGNGKLLRLVFRSYSGGAMVLSGDATLSFPPAPRLGRDVLSLDASGSEEDGARASDAHSISASFENLTARLERGETTASQEKIILAEDLWRFREIMGSREPQSVPLTLLGSYFSAIFGMEFPGAGAIYYKQTLNRRAPVKIGDKVVVTVELKELNRSRKDPKEAFATFDCTCKVDDKVVLDGKAELIVPIKATEGSAHK